MWRRSAPAERPGRAHFIGVGGIGMSGLASICHARGWLVSGCDTSMTPAAASLRALGVPITVGHHPSHIHEALDLVVYSSAIRPEEPERYEARLRGVRAISRGRLLAELAEGHTLIAVAGAHGKTTTSGMAAQLLLQAGWDPTVAVGGVMRSLGTNARAGRGRYFVAETDESDGSFLHLAPTIAILTNIDREHLNHYGSLERLTAAFRQFVAQMDPAGVLIRCNEDPLARRAVAHPSMITYALRAEADVTAQALTAPNGRDSRFKAIFRGRSLGAFRLMVPGWHNVLNALGVIGLGLALELPLATIREALEAFEGTRRRFQVFELPRDIRFIEDYAHHPAEIRATLAADATRRHRLAVFQPHRYSRTHLLEGEFSACFDRADGVIVTDIYGAFEPPIPGISGERLAGLIRAHGHPHVRYVPRPELASVVRWVVSPGDTVFFLGAGDIGEVCHGVARQLHSALGTA
jgi:UDP-N-acetylmuramate--alanine ligase